MIYTIESTDYDHSDYYIFDGPETDFQALCNSLIEQAGFNSLSTDSWIFSETITDELIKLLEQNGYVLLHPVKISYPNSVQFKQKNDFNYLPFSDIIIKKIKEHNKNFDLKLYNSKYDGEYNKYKQEICVQYMEPEEKNQLCKCGHLLSNHSIELVENCVCKHIECGCLNFEKLQP